VKQLADELAKRALMGFLPGCSRVTNRNRAVNFRVPFQKPVDLVSDIPSVVGDNQHFLTSDRVSVLLALRLSLGVREAKANIVSNSIDI
jgi:hypothetical protein